MYVCCVCVCGPVLLSRGALSFNFSTSVFASSIAFVGTDLLKEPFGSGSRSSRSGSTGTCLK